MICFSNPGEIDIRTITTLGVNVKPNESAIGYFGTGLKFAIATLLRHGQEIIIYSGETKIEFKSFEQIVRGKSFEFIHMFTTEPNGTPSEIPLGFTTDLGKNWTLENAYRELWSNCKDEGGEVWNPILSQNPLPNETLINIYGKKFEYVHENSSTFILPPDLVPMYSSGLLDVYAQSSSGYFYKGFKASTFDKPSKFLYNFKGHLTLTEDRTIANEYEFNWTVREVLYYHMKKSDLIDIFTNDIWEEHDWSLSSPGPSASEDFFSALEFVHKEYPLKLTSSIKGLAVATTQKKTLPKEAVLTEAQAAQIAACICKIQELIPEISHFRIHVAESLGDRILGRAVHFEGEAVICLSLLVFKQNELFPTLLEETIHLAFGVPDCTREFQDVSMKLLCKLMGEPSKSRQLSPLEQFINDEIPF